VINGTCTIVGEAVEPGEAEQTAAIEQPRVTATDRQNQIFGDLCSLWAVASNKTRQRFRDHLAEQDGGETVETPKAAPLPAEPETAAPKAEEPMAAPAPEPASALPPAPLNLGEMFRDVQHMTKGAFRAKWDTRRPGFDCWSDIHTDGRGAKWAVFKTMIHKRHPQLLRRRHEPLRHRGSVDHAARSQADSGASRRGRVGVKLFKVSERKIEALLQREMPAATHIVAGQRRWRVEAVEPWLRERGAVVDAAPSAETLERRRAERERAKFLAGLSPVTVDFVDEKAAQINV
jgi:hypothetical protein